MKDLTADDRDFLRGVLDEWIQFIEGYDDHADPTMLQDLRARVRDLKRKLREQTTP